ncbi:MAG: GNAT family N-acetyltransferase [Candidatus Omnitrophota bacterium]
MIETKIKIQRAKEQDWPYIQEKLKNYLLDASEASWQQFFVLKNGSKAVAFARLRDHGDYFELASLGVDYYHRKKGYGTKMLAFIIQETRKIDPQKPIYGVTHKPEWLRSFGFEEVDDYPQYLDHKKNHVCVYPYKIKIMRNKT